VLTGEQVERIGQLCEQLFDEDHMNKPGMSELLRAVVDDFFSKPTGEQVRIVRGRWNPASRAIV